MISMCPASPDQCLTKPDQQDSSRFKRKSWRNRVFIFWYVWNVNLFLTFCWKGEIELWLFHLTADIIQRLGSGLIRSLPGNRSKIPKIRNCRLNVASYSLYINQQKLKNRAIPNKIEFKVFDLMKSDISSTLCKIFEIL